MRTYTVTEYDREDYDAVRENMTNEEVVDLLYHIKRGYLSNYNCDGSEDDFFDFKLHIAIEKAIAALKE